MEPQQPDQASGTEPATSREAGRGELLRLARQTIREVTTSGPVSYTHLRAHETVLDIVCRLLLEKKNKNVTQLQLQHIHSRY